MKLLFAYVKLHYKSVVMFLAFSAVFAVVTYLYSLPLEAVGYAVVLCFFFALVIVAVSFRRFKARHGDFERLQQSIMLGLDELPEPRNISEEDYTRLIKVLFDEKCRAESEKAGALSEMNDYYTLWAHQIKTPIAAMNLLLQQENCNNSELSDQLFKIEQYVGMVLTYLRCGFKTADYVIKRCELDSIIKSAVRKYAKLFIREKISLDYSETSFTAVSDEKWLSFVIEQIISNALKYTKSGKVSIYMENGGTLVIEDTGIGIAAEDLPRICEEGFTGYNGRADKKSTGIGLYLCKKVLDGLGHSLTITSAAGVGTKVAIGLAQNATMYE